MYICEFMLVLWCVFWLKFIYKNFRILFSKDYGYLKNGSKIDVVFNFFNNREDKNK